MDLKWTHQTETNYWPFNGMKNGHRNCVICPNIKKEKY